MQAVVAGMQSWKKFAWRNRFEFEPWRAESFYGCEDQEDLGAWIARWIVESRSQLGRDWTVFVQEMIIVVIQFC